MYGTLLGFHRNGDFIEGDDDFDVGYFSAFNTAVEVKEETKRIVVDLVLAGYICFFNKKGRLFRLRLPGDNPSIHLDVRPLWYEDKHVWAYKHACLSLETKDFIPSKQGTLRRIPVEVPGNIESFLKEYYGPGWKVPDPGYSNSSLNISVEVTNKLKTVYITPKEYCEMVEKIESQRSKYPKAGKLISMGSYSLYPLEACEANVGW